MANIECEMDGYIALFTEADVANQGDTAGNVRENLKEALELFFETASANQDPPAFTEPDHRKPLTGTLMSITRQSRLPRTPFEQPER